MAGKDEMTPIPRLFCTVLILCFVSIHALSQLSDSQAELQLGIAAFEKAAYKEAIAHLERAILFDPGSVSSRPKLADAYNEMYCLTCEFDSASDAGANDHWRVLAIAEYKKVLELAPSNTQVLNSLAYVYYWHAELDEAERNYRKAIEVDATNAEALYTLAVIDWRRSYQVRVQKRTELKLNQKQLLIGLSSCRDIRTENLDRINEGIGLLTTTLQVLDVPEAMVYISILHRERADIQCGDRAAYQDDIKTSALWEHRACQTKINADRVNVPARWPPGPPPSDGGENCLF